MIAALPMYDHPAVAQANNQFWGMVRKALGYGPRNLTRDMDIWDIWQNPDLLLAQTCGYPYRARLHGHVKLIGTPDYGLHNCPAGYYNSVFITRRDDPRGILNDYHGAAFAYNDPMSQSGWASPMSHIANTGIQFAKHIPTGAHYKSAQMVFDRGADIAAIDAVTWATLLKHDKHTEDLHVVGHTEPTPGLPFIAAMGQDKPALFSAIAAAINALSEAQKDKLRIKGLVDIPAARYLSIPTPDGPDKHIS